MKHIILIMAFLVTSYAGAAGGYRYTPKTNKNFFSLSLGWGPVSSSWEATGSISPCAGKSKSPCSGRNYRPKESNEEGFKSLKTEFGPIFVGQYNRMFSNTFGANLGFMSNNTGFAGITIGW